MQLLSFKKRMENSCVSLFSFVNAFLLVKREEIVALKIKVICNTFQFTLYGISSIFKFQNINLNVTIVNVSHLNPAFTND